MTLLFLANAALSTITVAFGLAGALRPSLMTRSDAPSLGERFFARMYASRAVPLGALAAAAPFVAAGPGGALVLFAAAAAQLGDVAIGANRKERSMILGGAAAAAIHAATGLATL